MQHAGCTQGDRWINLGTISLPIRWFKSQLVPAEPDKIQTIYVRLWFETDFQEHQRILQSICQRTKTSACSNAMAFGPNLNNECWQINLHSLVHILIEKQGHSFDTNCIHLGLWYTPY